MVKEVITYIAYQTTNDLMSPGLKRLGPHGRVKSFISMAIVFTVVAIVLVINAFFLQKKVLLTAGVFFSFYGLLAVVYLVVHLIFKHSTLARSIRLYKGSKMASYGGAIGLFYMLLNLAIIVLTMIFGFNRY